MRTGLDVVTGAFSYTGSYITDRLLNEGRDVRTLTRRPRPPESPTEIEVAPYRWDIETLTAAMAGADTLYNTYWIRLARGQTTFDEAVTNSRLLFQAARDAGAKRIVHVSITKADQAPYLPYFAGKAAVEAALHEVGVPFAIVRPTVVFGRNDVLINNIAWLLRRMPLFVIAGSGDYRVRPVYVDDVARICIEVGHSLENVTVDAVGPEIMFFKEMVRHIREAVRSRSLFVHAPRRTPGPFCLAILQPPPPVGTHGPDHISGWVFLSGFVSRNQTQNGNGWVLRYFRGPQSCEPAAGRRDRSLVAQHPRQLGLPV